MVLRDGIPDVLIKSTQFERLNQKIDSFYVAIYCFPLISKTCQFFLISYMMITVTLGRVTAIFLGCTIFFRLENLMNLVALKFYSLCFHQSYFHAHSTCYLQMSFSGNIKNVPTSRQATKRK